MSEAVNSFISIRMKDTHEGNILFKYKKPAFLYHASPRSDLNELIPQKKTFRDPLEGPVIFATPDLPYATMFLIPTDDTWCVLGSFNNVYYMAIAGKNRFLENDKGGTIYTLPVDTFYCDLTKSGREKEWVSRLPVKPVNTTTYTSAFFAMMEHGVQIYFIKEKDLEKIKTSSDFGYKILRSKISENKTRGIQTMSL